MKFRFFALAAMGLSTLALAQDSNRIPAQQKIGAAKQTAQAFTHLVLPGKEVSSGIRKLRKELKWYKTLRVASREAKKTGKPILWIQALGKLSGYT